MKINQVKWNQNIYKSYYDTDNIVGTLSFNEYIQACQVTDLDTIEDKLAWIFTAFDSDGGGSIDYDEITDICQGLFRMAGIEEDEDLLASCVADVR